MGVDETCFFLRQVASSQNRVYLNANTLMLNINEPDFDDASDKLASVRS
jgi:hypothetical protein